MNDTDEDSALEAGSFGDPIRPDLMCQPTGKTQRGEGVCLYINYKWCQKPFKFRGCLTALTFVDIFRNKCKERQREAALDNEQRNNPHTVKENKYQRVRGRRDSAM